jgi:hypothetical protein
VVLLAPVPQALYHAQRLPEQAVRTGGARGRRGYDYQIHFLQSAGILRQVIVVKDPAPAVDGEGNEVLGPMALSRDHHQHELNAENTSRCFEIPSTVDRRLVAFINARKPKTKSG